MYLDTEFHRLFASSSSPRISVRMRPVLDFLDNQLRRLKIRQQTYSGYETLGFRLLLNIVFRGMSDELAECNTDFERLYDVLNFQRDSLTRTFDSSNGGGHHGRKGFINSPSCKEYIFSVVPRDPRREYPLDKGKEAWRSYRPFRMIDHDSGDHTLNIASGLLHFTRDIPHFAIFTFDPVAAILQYANLQDEMNIAQYVHEYLILPALTLDNQRLWLMGVYSEWFNSRSRTYTDIPMVTTNYSHIPLNINRALQEIGDIIDSSRTGNVGVQRLLSSLVLPYDTTISKYATVLYNRSSVDDVGEYQWGTFMIYRRMLDIAMRVLSLTVNSRDSQVDIYRLKRVSDLMQSARLSSAIHDAYTKQFVSQSINTLHMQITNLYDRVKYA